MRARGVTNILGVIVLITLILGGAYSKYEPQIKAKLDEWKMPKKAVAPKTVEKKPVKVEVKVKDDGAKAAVEPPKPGDVMPEQPQPTPAPPPEVKEEKGWHFEWKWKGKWPWE